VGKGVELCFGIHECWLLKRKKYKKVRGRIGIREEERRIIGCKRLKTCIKSL